MYRCLCFVIYVLVFNDCANNEPLRKTVLGDLQGFYMETHGGRIVSAFTGIPYAQPPVGQLRFKAPVPVSPWEGTFNASKKSPLCVQRNFSFPRREISGQEDCLYLNIYTPFLENEPVPEKELLPVMVFIPGGRWMYVKGAGDIYGPDHLLDRNVLLVTMNYRLGTLGFLSTLDKNCPGNNGLKDQQEALRFLQKTIIAFGGNPNSVTIFGESAGGVSVNYHMLSETSVGLFHKAISESGTAFVPWAETSPGEAKRNALMLARSLNCPRVPSELMIMCLRGFDSYDIIAADFSIYYWDYESMSTIKVVVEPDLPGAFLTRSPRKSPSTSFVPWLTGLNQNEGCLKSIRITSDEYFYKAFITDFDEVAPFTFYYDHSQYPSVITARIKSFYFGQTYQTTIEEIEEHIIKDQIAKIYSDTYFDFPTVKAVEFALTYSNNPIYLYQLSYRAMNSFSQIFGDPVGNYGVCHADELMYLFPLHFLKHPFTDTDEEMSELFLNMWTNFATSGNPNKPLNLPFNWEPATSDVKLEYLDIGSTQEMKLHLGERSRFWTTMPVWYNMLERISDEL